MVECKPLNATFSHQRSCDANQTLAEKTANRILNWPHRVRYREAAPAPTEQCLSRLRACAGCPLCSNRGRFTSALAALLSQVRYAFDATERALGHHPAPAGSHPYANGGPNR